MYNTCILEDRFTVVSMYIQKIKPIMCVRTVVVLVRYTCVHAYTAGCLIGQGILYSINIHRNYNYNNYNNYVPGQTAG